MNDDRHGGPPDPEMAALFELAATPPAAPADARQRVLRRVALTVGAPLAGPSPGPADPTAALSTTGAGTSSSVSAASSAATGAASGAGASTVVATGVAAGAWVAAAGAVAVVAAAVWFTIGGSADEPPPPMAPDTMAQSTAQATQPPAFGGTRRATTPGPSSPDRERAATEQAQALQAPRADRNASPGSPRAVGVGPTPAERPSDARTAPTAPDRADPAPRTRGPASTKPAPRKRPAQASQIRPRTPPARPAAPEPPTPARPMASAGIAGGSTADPKPPLPIDETAQPMTARADRAASPAPAGDISPDAPTGRPTFDRALGAERRLLVEALRALERPDLPAMRRALEAHRAEYPTGRLVEERSLLEIRLLLAAGQRAEARAAADAFRQRWPDSLFGPAIEALLPPTP